MISDKKGINIEEQTELISKSLVTSIHMNNRKRKFLFKSLLGYGGSHLMGKKICFPGVTDVFNYFNMRFKTLL